MVSPERFRNHRVCVSWTDGCPTVDDVRLTMGQGLGITFYGGRIQILCSEEKWNWVVNWSGIQGNIYSTAFSEVMAVNSLELGSMRQKRCEKNWLEKNDDGQEDLTVFFENVFNRLVKSKGDRLVQGRQVVYSKGGYLHSEIIPKCRWRSDICAILLRWGIRILHVQFDRAIKVGNPPPYCGAGNVLGVSSMKRKLNAVTSLCTSPYIPTSSMIEAKTF